MTKKSLRRLRRIPPQSLQPLPITFRRRSSAGRLPADAPEESPDRRSWPLVCTSATFDGETMPPKQERGLQRLAGCAGDGRQV